MVYSEPRARQGCQPNCNSYQLTSPFAYSTIKLNQRLWRKWMHH
jgi:hypothetical protein